MADETNHEEQGAGGGASPFTFDGDNASYIAQKGFKSGADIVGALKSYEGKTFIPGEGATAEQISAFNKAFGVPSAAEDYKLSAPEGQDQAFAKAIGPMFLKAGISAKQAQTMQTEWNNMLSAKDTEIKAKYDADVAALKAELKTDEKYNAFMQSAKNYAQKAGWTADEISAIEKAKGTAYTFKLFNKLGETMQDHKILENQNGNGTAGGEFDGISAAEAKQKIAAIDSGRDVEFSKKLANNDLKAWKDYNSLFAIMTGGK